MPLPSFSIALAVTPRGRLYVEHADSAPSRVLTDVAAAFASSQAAGLLGLASGAALEASLPASFAFARDLAKLYFERACATPDLQTATSIAEIVPPEEDLAALLLAAPPMRGAEYLDAAALATAFAELDALVRTELGAWKGSVATYLHDKSPLWNVVGRVCFHLAENKRDADAPFAFLATYATGVSAGGRVQHAPLGRAIEEHAGARRRDKLLALLEPVHRAAEASAVTRALVDSGDVYHPLAWTPAEAYAFLKDVPILESKGLVVRMPDALRSRRASRPQVEVKLGTRAPGGVGLDAMLDFSVHVTLEGETLSRAEQKALLASSEGLVLLKGKWVVVDGARLGDVLDRWKKAEAEAQEHGIGFIEAMRLLSGVTLDAEAPDLAKADASWASVTAGPWLDELLAKLKQPESGGVDPQGLAGALRPYQRDGVAWLVLLARLGLGACLADDMGLGKTIQVIALMLHLRAGGRPPPYLLVVPASLLGNWSTEIERFAPSLKYAVAHPSAGAGWDKDRATKELEAADVVLTTYGTIARAKWLRERAHGLVVLDEAQAIKNPAAQQTRAVKELRAAARVALTGTPVENRLGDLWSIFDFLNPGLLGQPTAFKRLAKRIEGGGTESFAPLRNLVRPYLLRRMKSDRRVAPDLPDKTEVRAFCSLSKKQAALYARSVEELKDKLEGAEGMAKRGLVLAFLLRFKQICNHPSQWLGDGEYGVDESGKVKRLLELCEPIAARQEKVLVFTQFREMVDPLARWLEGVFGRPGLTLHGGTRITDRKDRVATFADELGPPFFVLSLKAGGTGLNLTAASHVIHFDRWWNPAVENQATDRAYRIGQHANVVVHKFVCRGTIEERVDALIESKRTLSNELFSGGGELPLTELGRDELLRLVSLDIRSALDEG